MKDEDLKINGLAKCIDARWTDLLVEGKDYPVRELHGRYITIENGGRDKGWRASRFVFHRTTEPASAPIGQASPSLTQQEK